VEALDSSRAVRASTMHRHPGHPKATGRGAAAGGIVGTAYNVASIVQAGTGTYTVTLTTAMADTNYWVVATALSGATERVVQASISSTTVFTITVKNGNNTLQDEAFGFAVFGDQ
jgi:hypothetical protein